MTYVFDDWFTLSQQKTMVMVPRCSAALSLPASLFIIYEALHDHRRGKGTPIQRALIGMSVFDCLSSFGYLMSSWFVPKGFIWGSAGNMATCNLSAFLALTACGPPMFNSCIALFCMLIIVYRWTDARIARMERYIYPVIFVWAFGVNFVMMFFHLYNPVGSICWPAEVWGCYGGVDFETGEPCSDPHNKPYAWVYAIVVFYVPIYLSFIIILVCLIMIFIEVRRTHLRLLRYAFQQPGSSDRSSIRSSMQGSINSAMRSSARSSVRGSLRASLRGSTRASSVNHVQGRSRNDLARIAVKAILYSAIFVITFLPSTVWSVYGYTGVSPFGVVVAALLCEPLQGFYNMLTFIRDRPSSRQRLIKFLTCGLGCACCSWGKFSSSNADTSNTSNRDAQRLDDSAEESKQNTGGTSSLDIEASNDLQREFDEAVRKNTESNARHEEDHDIDEGPDIDEEDDEEGDDDVESTLGADVPVENDIPGPRISSDLEFAEG